MGESIHTLFTDLQKLEDGEEQYKRRTRQTALTFGFDEIVKEINEGNYHSAKLLVIEEWANGEYGRDLEAYVPEHLSDQILSS